MEETITANWMGNMAFEAEVNDHRIVLDTGPEVGGQHKGPKPKPLMLVALAIRYYNISLVQPCFYLCCSVLSMFVLF